MQQLFVTLNVRELHYEELQEVTSSVKKQIINAEINVIEPVFLRFCEAADDFHHKIEPIHHLHLTQSLREIDKDRDRCFSHMRMVMTSFLKSSFDEKRDAAALLNNVFSHFRGVQRENYQKASGMYTLMLKKLRKDNYPAALETLGIAAEADRLNELNTTFKDQYQYRINIEDASAPATEVKAASRLLVARYHELMQTLESCIRLGHVPNHEELVDSINSVLSSYKTTLAHRRAYLKSKREKKAAEKQQQQSERKKIGTLAKNSL